MMVRLMPFASVLLFALLASAAAAQEKSAEKGAKDEPAHEKAVEAAGSKAKEGDEHAAKTEHGEHHDETDLTHANISSPLTSPLGSFSSLTNPIAIKSDLPFFTVIVFVLLVSILTKFAWKPIARGLEHREKGIEEKIEQARIAAEQATEQLKQYEAKLAAATAEAQQIVAKARQDADAAGQKIVAEAQAAATKERERAVADIGAAKNQALREIAERSVDTAVSLARNIIRREVRPGDHEQLIQEALKQFPAHGGSLN